MKKYLTLADRLIIEQRLKAGLTHREIAQELGFSRSSVTREASRCKDDGFYSAEKAQNDRNQKWKDANRSGLRPHQLRNGSVKYRLLCLEEQMSIVLDQLKELRYGTNNKL